MSANYYDDDKYSDDSQEWGSGAFREDYGYYFLSEEACQQMYYLTNSVKATIPTVFHPIGRPLPDGGISTFRVPKASATIGSPVADQFSMSCVFTFPVAYVGSGIQSKNEDMGVTAQIPDAKHPLDVAAGFNETCLQSLLRGAKIVASRPGGEMAYNMNFLERVGVRSATPAALHRSNSERYMLGLCTSHRREKLELSKANPRRALLRVGWSGYAALRAFAYEERAAFGYPAGDPLQLLADPGLQSQRFVNPDPCDPVNGYGIVFAPAFVNNKNTFALTRDSVTYGIPVETQREAYVSPTSIFNVMRRRETFNIIISRARERASNTFWADFLMACAQAAEAHDLYQEDPITLSTAAPMAQLEQPVQAQPQVQPQPQAQAQPQPVQAQAVQAQAVQAQAVQAVQAVPFPAGAQLGVPAQAEATADTPPFDTAPQAAGMAPAANYGPAGGSFGSSGAFGQPQAFGAAPTTAVNTTQVADAQARLAALRAQASGK